MRNFTKRLFSAAACIAMMGMIGSSVFAADRLTVKDSGNVVQFNVQDTGAVGIGTTLPTSKLHIVETATGDVPVAQTYQNSTLRMNFRSNGIQEWYLNGGTADVGAIKYSTPGSNPAIALSTSPTFDQNMFYMANYVTHFRMYYGGALGVYILKNGMGVNTTSAIAPLDVKAVGSGVVVQSGLTSADKNNVIAGGTFTGTDPATYIVTIDNATGTNTFKWNKNGGAYTTGVALTGAAQALSDGVTINFGATTGFKLNATWTIYAGRIANFENAAGTSVMAVNANGKVGIGTLTPTSSLQVVGIPVFTSNSLAVAGGLTPGAFYRTGADPDVLCVVH